MIERVKDMWEDRGGGYYALCAVLTFLFLEGEALVDDVLAADGIGDLIQGGIVEWLISFGLDTIMNTLLAAIWPVEWIDRMGVLPAALVAGALFGAWWAGSRVWTARTDIPGSPKS
ncbi:MAG: hypothetical protein RH859_07815 [Longimicrobiales bacterium]